MEQDSYSPEPGQPDISKHVSEALRLNEETEEAFQAIEADHSLSPEESDRLHGEVSRRYNEALGSLPEEVQGFAWATYAKRRQLLTRQSDEMPRND